MSITVAGGQLVLRQPGTLDPLIGLQSWQSVGTLPVCFPYTPAAPSTPPVDVRRLVPVQHLLPPGTRIPMNAAGIVEVALSYAASPAGGPKIPWHLLIRGAA